MRGDITVGVGYIYAITWGVQLSSPVLLRIQGRPNSSFSVVSLVYHCSVFENTSVLYKCVL